MDFVQVVKTKIKQNGFKQNFIADKIGLNTVSLTDRLTGKVKFKTDEVFKLANEFTNYSKSKIWKSKIPNDRWRPLVLWQRCL